MRGRRVEHAWEPAGLLSCKNDAVYALPAMTGKDYAPTRAASMLMYALVATTACGGFSGGRHVDSDVGIVRSGSGRVEYGSVEDALSDAKLAKFPCAAAGRRAIDSDSLVTYCVREGTALRLVAASYGPTTFAQQVMAGWPGGDPPKHLMPSAFGAARPEARPYDGWRRATLVSCHRQVGYVFESRRADVAPVVVRAASAHDEDYMNGVASATGSSETGAKPTASIVRFIDRAGFEKHFGPMMKPDACIEAAQDAEHFVSLPGLVKQTTGAIVDAGLRGWPAPPYLRPLAKPTFTAMADHPEWKTFDARVNGAEEEWSFFQSLCYSAQDASVLEPAYPHITFPTLATVRGNCKNHFPVAVTPWKVIVAKESKKWQKASVDEKAEILATLARATDLRGNPKNGEIGARRLFIDVLRADFAATLREAAEKGSPSKPWTRLGQVLLANRLHAGRAAISPALQSVGRSALSRLLPEVKPLEGEIVDPFAVPMVTSTRFEVFAVANLLGPEPWREPRGAGTVGVAAGPRFLRQTSQPIFKSVPVRQIVRVPAGPPDQTAVDTIRVSEARLRKIEQELTLQNARLGYVNTAEVGTRCRFNHETRLVCDQQGGGASAAQTWITMDANMNIEKLHAEARTLGDVIKRYTPAATPTPPRELVTVVHEQEIAGTLWSTEVQRMVGVGYANQPVVLEAATNYLGSDTTPRVLSAKEIESTPVSGLKAVSRALKKIVAENAKATLASLDASDATEAAWLRYALGLPHQFADGKDARGPLSGLDIFK